MRGRGSDGANRARRSGVGQCSKVVLEPVNKESALSLHALECCSRRNADSVCVDEILAADVDIDAWLYLLAEAICARKCSVKRRAC